jgi:hypothetical protein
MFKIFILRLIAESEENSHNTSRSSLPSTINEGEEEPEKNGHIPSDPHQSEHSQGKPAAKEQEGKSSVKSKKTPSSPTGDDEIMV